MEEARGIQYAGPPDSELIFSGPPSKLRGSIRLMNPTSERQKLRTLSVNSERLLGAARLPLREIQLPARLDPGQQAMVQSTIALDPHTPPGTYALEVTIGEQVFAAAAHVAEVVDLRIQPAEISILADGGNRYYREFVVENAGNVLLPLAARYEAPLIDFMNLRSTLISGLHKESHPDERGQLESLLRELGERTYGALVIEREASVLQPGEKLSTGAQFVLPHELRPSRHYRAEVQIFNAALGIHVYTTDKAGSHHHSG